MIMTFIANTLVLLRLAGCGERQLTTPKRLQSEALPFFIIPFWFLPNFFQKPSFINTISFRKVIWRKLGFMYSLFNFCVKKSYARRLGLSIAAVLQNSLFLRASNDFESFQHLKINHDLQTL